jgi:hypothetical protein
MEKHVEVPIYIGDPVASIEEAQSRLHFSVKEPKVLPVGYKLDRITISYPEDAPNEYLRIVYVSGEHHIIVGQAPWGPEMRLFTDEEMAELRQQKITIGGFPGMGHGPGISKTKEALQEYSSVMWWPPGIRRTVWTEDDASLSMEDLLAVAESMEVAP